jgi:hypothetical protein
MTRCLEPNGGAGRNSLLDSQGLVSDLGGEGKSFDLSAFVQNVTSAGFTTEEPL